MSVVVFGSINMDLVARVERLPKAGETLIGQGFSSNPGGKGANQAVAAARLGAQVRMVGRVGDDALGCELRESLRKDGIDVSGVAADASCSSGTAVIEVAANGENRIIVIPGANGQVGADDLERLDAALGDAKVLLLQLEIPMEAVLAAAEKAKARGVAVILDPAPARSLPPQLYRAVDFITPNQSEAELLTGQPVDGVEDAKAAAGKLLEQGVENAIIKMGRHGAYWADGADELYLPAIKVDVVDTVAAGDAFNGALAAALAEGRLVTDALEWGLGAGALAVSRAGAQQAMPARNEVLDILENVRR